MLAGLIFDAMQVNLELGVQMKSDGDAFCMVLHCSCSMDSNLIPTFANKFKVEITNMLP